MKANLLLPLLSVAGTAAANTPKPNILWIMAEDMGQDLECYGVQAVKTPVLNRMAREGVLYNNACCSNPISSPSRSAMMTGVHQTLIEAHNHRSNRDRPLTDGVKPITYYLRRAGYTCILGNSQVMNRGRKIDCNFKCTPLGEWNGVDKFGLFDKYDEFTAADQPFFAQIQLNVTHRGDWWKRISAASAHPVNPAQVVLPPYMADHPKIREEWACYLDQVEYMDGEVGKLLQELEDKGILDNTIVFFIADNGRCDIRGKGYLYEPGTKIPMIVWGKGIAPGVVDDIVSTLDISASILDLASAELPDYLSGKPLFRDGLPVDGCDYFYAARDNWDEIAECIRSVSTTRFTYIRNYMPQYGWDRHQVYLDFHRPAVHVMRTLKAEGKLTPDELLFFADSKPVEELYDIVADPHELRNLAQNPEYAEVLEAMRAKMDEWQKNHRDGGLADLDDRHPVQTGTIQSGAVRRWVQRQHPEAWQELTKGGICRNFSAWVKEAAAAQKHKTGEKRSDHE